MARRSHPCAAGRCTLRPRRCCLEPTWPARWKVAVLTVGARGRALADRVCRPWLSQLSSQLSSLSRACGGLTCCMKPQGADEEAQHCRQQHGAKGKGLRLGDLARGLPRLAAAIDALGAWRAPSASRPAGSAAHLQAGVLTTCGLKGRVHWTLGLDTASWSSSSAHLRVSMLCSRWVCISAKASCMPCTQAARACCRGQAAWEALCQSAV